MTTTALSSKVGPTRDLYTRGRRHKDTSRDDSIGVDPGDGDSSHGGKRPASRRQANGDGCRREMLLGPPEERGKGASEVDLFACAHGKTQPDEYQRTGDRSVALHDRLLEQTASHQ
ncbi:MAG: hypothetical protein AAGB00_12650 [Planctomycetota bacterium]